MEMPNREEWLEGDEMHPSATELPGDGPVTFVRPVGTPSGTPEKGPLRFEFKTPQDTQKWTAAATGNGASPQVPPHPGR